MKTTHLEKNRRVLIKKLRQLIKPRRYLVRLWDINCAWIEAAWESDTRVSLEKISLELIPRWNKRPIDAETFRSLLGQFQSGVLCLCEASDTLAKQFKKNKAEFFEDMLFEAERP